VYFKREQSAEESGLNQQDIMTRLQQAAQFHQLGQIENAVQGYEEILRTAPDTFDAVRLLGIARVQQGQPTEAVALLEKALTIRPASLDVQGYLGLAYKAAGRLAESEDCYRKALASNPNDTNTIINLGNLLILQERASEATVFYQRAMELRPQDPVCHTLMGDALSMIGHRGEAKLSYGKALSLQPNHVEAHNGIGLLEMSAGQLHDAITAFEKALELRPNDAHIHNNLGQALQRQHRYEDAATQFRKALAIQPTLMAAHNNLGGALFEIESAEAALQSYETALQTDPTFTPALLNQGIALFDESEPEKAFRSFDAALSASKEHSLARAYRDISFHLCNPEGPLPDKNEHPVPEACAIIESYLYMRENGPGAKAMSRHRDVLKLAVEAAPVDGLVLEFGVFFGHSIRYLAGLAGGDVHGFDSFEGIPEKWFQGEDAGAYTTGGKLPPVPDNVTLHVGWFNETLVPFKASHDGPIRLANIDCDIYVSTKCIFDELENQMVEGTILIFDEYLCYPDWQEHEYKAFQEFIQRTGWEYEYLAYSLFSRQTVVRLLTQSSTSKK